MKSWSSDITAQRHHIQSISLSTYTTRPTANSLTLKSLSNLVESTMQRTSPKLSSMQYSIQTEASEFTETKITNAYISFLKITHNEATLSSDTNCHTLTLWNRQRNKSPMRAPLKAPLSLSPASLSSSVCHYPWFKSLGPMLCQQEQLPRREAPHHRCHSKGTRP